MKHLILIVLVIAGSKTYAQKNNHPGSFTKDFIVEVNPFGRGTSKRRMRYGSTVKFKISHVNPFKIEGTNSITKESISFDIPAQFSKALAATAANEGSDDTPKMNDNGNLDFSMGFLQQSSAMSNSLDKNKKGIKSSNITDSLNRQLEILQKQIELQNELLKQQNALQLLREDFATNYNGFVKSFHKLSLYTSIEDYIDSLLRETFITDTATLKANLRGYLTSINDDESDINSIRSRCRQTLEDVDKYYINAKGAYDELAKHYKNEISSFKGTINDPENKIKLKIDSARITMEREKIFEKEFEFLTLNYTAINTGDKRTAIITKTNKGIDYYNVVYQSNFVVFTDAQQLNDDKITITPKLKNYKGEIIKEYNPVEIKTYGGWKVDFSTGYLLSFKGDAHYTNLYDSSGISGVQKDRQDHLKHAIGALINVYPRTGRDLSAGLSVGVSLPTDGTGVGFYAGISAFMLEKNRMVLTFGVSENKVNLLNTGNLTRDLIAEKATGKETYKFSNKDYREITYNNVYRPSFFIGISYNIFTVKP